MTDAEAQGLEVPKPYACIQLLPLPSVCWPQLDRSAVQQDLLPHGSPGLKESAWVLAIFMHVPAGLQQDIVDAAFDKSTH